MKKAGCLMPISGLPSPYGIGDFGDTAYQFIDILASMKLRIWQVLPLNPLGYGNSPYQAYSAFAGDEIYISPNGLIDDGLLCSTSIINPDVSSSIDYTAARVFKRKLLEIAFDNFLNLSEDLPLKIKYQEFIAKHDWVKNYAIFMTFKQVNGLALWTLWPDEYKNWIKSRAIDINQYNQQINYHIFTQFIFYSQWLELKAYANSLNIEIMGDIPIYLGLDSADVWEHQEIFLLDDKQNPTYVAGVPPDFFSKTGQRWGNPLYNWDVLVADGFKFWIDRLSMNAKLFDIIRIDHFRAFDTYWKIPASSKTAIDGTWATAPGHALLDKIYEKLPDINIVAEDLGDLRQEVFILRDSYGLKGMKVLPFHFNPLKSNDEFEHSTNIIIYTGTHDNNTLLGWYKSLSAKKKKELRSYFGISHGPNSIAKGFKRAVIDYILACDAQYVIFPIQDILGLDKQARLNTPSSIGSPNWEWRLLDYTTLMDEASFMAKAVTKAKR